MRVFPHQTITCVSTRTHLSRLFTAVFPAPRKRPGPQQGLHEICWWMNGRWFRAGLGKFFSAKIQIVNIFGFGRHTAALLWWDGKQPLAICTQMVWLYANKIIHTNGRRAAWSLPAPGLAQHCPIALSVVTECSLSVLYCIGSHWPHVTVEHLACGQCNWGIRFLILFNCN